MSRFLNEKYRGLVPYDTAGEHEAGAFVKLNTNESPFPPSPRALARAAEAAGTQNFYPDPDGRELTEKAAEVLGLRPEEVLLTCGSDEALSFIFMAFVRPGTGPGCGAAFPDITYSFYEILAGLNHVSFETIPLSPDFSLPVDRVSRPVGRTLFIANPNSPTGLALPRSAAERIIQGNPDNIVVIDEAYVDFGAESCVPLIRRYDNLLVVQTFSKSRSLAGARLGLCLGQADLIRDLMTLKNSIAPYNISGTTLAAGLGALEDGEYTRANCRTIMENRAFTAEKLRAMNFEVTDSLGNFLLARHPRFGGGELARKLKERGILVRCYSAPEALVPCVRITIGTGEQMESLLEALKSIEEEAR
ncbi:MAG: histidinol-phosphate transaminase [Fretibacterium sp.]|nr:histidinol-phosphate transaminase [Fretibacterium sp.]